MLYAYLFVDAPKDLEGECKKNSEGKKPDKNRTPLSESCRVHMGISQHNEHE